MVTSHRATLKPVQFSVAIFACVLGCTVLLAKADPPTAQQSPAANDSEDDFLRILPLPKGIEKIEPIVGSVNIRFKDCAAVWPNGYRAYLAESVAAEGHANRGDIYGWLRAKQAFESKDCSCTGKVANWAPVEAIYAGLRNKYGTVLLKHTAVYEDQARIFHYAVERLCGGLF